jgi:hypothetical protein
VIYGPKNDGTYVVEFRTAVGDRGFPATQPKSRAALLSRWGGFRLGYPLWKFPPRGTFAMWLLILAGVVVAIFVLLLLIGFYKDQLERSAAARMRD